MSSTTPTPTATPAKTMKATERVAGMGGPGRGGPFGGGMVGQKAMSFGPSLRRLLGRLKGERARVVAVVGAGVLSVALASVGPKVLGRATDLILAGIVGKRFPVGLDREQALALLKSQGQARMADMLAGVDLVPGHGVDFAALRTVLVIAVALYAFSFVLGVMQGYLLNEVVQRTVNRMRAEVEQKLNRLPLRYFDRQPRGELLSRVTNDIDNVAQSLQQSLSQLLSSLLTVVFILGMMLSISPTLALIALATVPATMLLAGTVMKRSQGQFINQWRRTGTLNGLVEEAFTGHSLVKVFGRQRDVQAAFEVENKALLEASFKAQFLSGLIMPIAMFIGSINYVVIAIVGALRVAAGAMTLGDVQAFIQYARDFSRPVTQVASMINTLQSGVASAERVFELLDAEEESREDALPHSAPVTHGRVAFEHVSFRYVANEPLLDDVSFAVERGQTVAIVGPTGAGKTTLINLIMRFYELDSGRITLDGADISKLRRNVLRSQIGMVLQDTWLFRGTIRQNIEYGKPGASEAEIVAAAKAAYVDHFVASLPAGYDTMIDDDGGAVSAGEKQLITIARAFLSNPALLILDEATSSVDTRTELLVQRAMSAIRKDRTSFVIAHRLSTIRDADLILVMEHGRIVEQGSHRELLQRDGAYAKLHHSQFSGEPAEVPPSHSSKGPARSPASPPAPSSA